MAGVCIAIYTSGLIAKNCIRLPIKTAQNSLKNLSGDTWMLLKSELAIYSGGCCFSNGVKEKNPQQQQQQKKTKPKTKLENLPEALT